MCRPAMRYCAAVCRSSSGSAWWLAALHRLHGKSCRQGLWCSCIAAFPRCNSLAMPVQNRDPVTCVCVVQYGQPPDEAALACSMALMGVACQAEGLSGRTLRKLPLLAWQRHQSSRGAVHSCAEFISLLRAALNAEQADRLSCGSKST